MTEIAPRSETRAFVTPPNQTAVARPYEALLNSCATLGQLTTLNQASM